MAHGPYILQTVITYASLCHAHVRDELSYRRATILSPGQSSIRCGRRVRAQNSPQRARPQNRRHLALTDLPTSLAHTSRHGQ